MTRKHSFDLKIERAEKHIDEFKSVLTAFRESKPYGVGFKRDPKTREIIYQVTRTKPIPTQLSVITGDILQNLRTALDYLVCSLVQANGKPITRDHMFPIFKEVPRTADDKARFDGKIDGMVDEAKDVIRNIKPYKGGDNLLWGIHALNNRALRRNL